MDMDMDKVMAARGGTVRTTTEVLVVAVGTAVEDAVAVEQRVVSAVERVAQAEGNLDAASDVTQRRPPWGRLLRGWGRRG